MRVITTLAAAAIGETDISRDVLSVAMQSTTHPMPEYAQASCSLKRIAHVRIGRKATSILRGDAYQLDVSFTSPFGLYPAARTVAPAGTVPVCK
jgi:hypothetical protein